MYRLLIVDDNTILASGLERYLSMHLKSAFIAVAGTGKECLETLNSGSFDLVLLDVRLPDESGDVLCREILRMYPGLRIIALTGLVDNSTVKKMLDAGASGYIVKTSITDEILEGITRVMNGGTFLGSDVS